MPASTSTVSFFDRLASGYDRRALQAVVYRPIHDTILGRLEDASPATIIDLGCGTGQLTRRLTRRFPDAVVVGIDLSAGMLTKAAGRLDSLASGSSALVRADAAHLPVASESVDLVVCTESFHWYHEQAATLDELAALIRPGGRLLIASTATYTGLGDELIHRLTRISGRPVRALPPQRLRRLLDSSGFDVVRQRRIPRLGPAAWPLLTDARRR